MANDEIEALLNELGQLLPEESKNPSAPTLLFAEVGDNYVGPSIFEDMGDHILYRDYRKTGLTDCLLDLWESFDPDKRWAEIEYVVRDGKFDATFTYQSEIDPNEESMERRSRIVKRHFGDKPIVYPPWEDDEGDFEL